LGTCAEWSVGGAFCGYGKTGPPSDNPTRNVPPSIRFIFVVIFIVTPDVSLMRSANMTPDFYLSGCLIYPASKRIGHF
jgi:hypothetical protein